MSTFAVCNTERLRLLALGRKLQVRIIRSPQRGDDGAAYPNPSGNDYILEIKDPRPTGTSIGLASARNQGNQTLDQANAISTGRWHDVASTAEHVIRIRGLLHSEARGAAAPNVQWLLYGAGETREGGLIPNATVQFA